MTEMTLAEILQLSVVERLEIAAVIWDSVAAEPAALPLAEKQRQEIVRRSEAHRNNPQEAIPLEEALERIRRSL